MIGIIIFSSILYSVVLWGIYALGAFLKKHETALATVGTIGLGMSIYILATSSNPVLLIALIIWFFCTVAIKPIQINSPEKLAQKQTNA